MRDDDKGSIPHVEPVTEQKEKPSAAIYLVHGTWAPEAPWTDEESMLTQTIMKTASPGVHVRRLVWSGRNNQSHRNMAAECLASELDANPTVPSVLIGHSHGGSVIQSALMQSISGKQVRGAVCFNTPFFTALRRNIESRLPVTFWFWVFGGMAAMSLLADVKPVLFLSAGAVWAAGVFVILWLHQTKLLSKRQESLVPQRKSCATRFFCLTTADDEAFGALSTIEAIGNLPVLLLSPLLLWLYMLIATVLVFGGVLPSLPMPNNSWWNVVGNYAVSIYIWAAVIYFVPFVFAFLVGIVALGLSQGIWDPLAPYLVRSIVTPVPLSAHVEFDELSLETRGELAHSLLYKNEAVCDKVATWVKESLKHCP